MFETKKIVYIDMDCTLCDYKAGFMKHAAKYQDLKYPQSQPGLYENLKPMPNAIDIFQWLNQRNELAVFILTAPSIKNPHSYSEKRIWVEEHLGLDIVPKLIISAYKGLNKGDYLIDDNTEGKGQEYFEGKILQFGSRAFPNWLAVRDYFNGRYS
ncbi:MAG: hypothetical protein RPR97_13495 [Colwellia sp.]